MSEIFRERVVESPVAPETAPQSTQPLVSDKLAGNETKLTDPLGAEEKKLEIWEGLNKRRYITDYFDIGNIDGEFSLKMQTSVIDKLIRGLLEEKGYEKNIENYKKELEEIENEIGSNRMELFKRIERLTGYAKVLNKMNELKKKKKLYLSLDE